MGAPSSLIIRRSQQARLDESKLYCTQRRGQLTSSTSESRYRLERSSDVDPETSRRDGTTVWRRLSRHLTQCVTIARTSLIMIDEPYCGSIYGVFADTQTRIFSTFSGRVSTRWQTGVILPS